MWTGSGFGHSVTSCTGIDDVFRQIDPGFLLVFNVRRRRISHRYRDSAVTRLTGSGFGQPVTSRIESDNAVRQVDPGFLLVFNVRRTRIPHRYRDIAVRRGTGSCFGPSMTSRNGSNVAVRKIDPRFAIGAPCIPTSYLEPFTRYGASKFCRYRIPRVSADSHC